jgi:hypothetical protein
MTRRNIKTIMAAFAVGAPMMVSGFVQAAPCIQDYRSPPSRGFAHGVTNVACKWVTDDMGNFYCVGIPGDQQEQVSPHR